eukprot:837212-Prymnesium_polylepis.1
MTQAVLEGLPKEVALIDSYGPTENTVDATNNVLNLRRVRLKSIGKPMPNVTCYVVDPEAPTPTLLPIG